MPFGVGAGWPGEGGGEHELQLQAAVGLFEPVVAAESDGGEVELEAGFEVVGEVGGGLLSSQGAVAAVEACGVGDDDASAG